MKTKLCVLAVVGGALALTSCNKKLGQFAADNFTTNPNPLEVVGEKVPATVTAHIPAKFFVKNAEVTVTPYLVYAGTETASQPYTFQGEKVRGNNPVVSYNNGGSYTIPVSYTYQPEMAKSELQLAFNVKQGNKQYALPRVTVANGVIATAALASAGGVNPALAPDAFQKNILEKYNADIMFLINVANIRSSQLQTDAMKELQKEIVAANADPKKVIKELNIKSYASPDGPYDFNKQLAEKRETNTKGYLNDQLKKDKITEFGELTAQFTAEDWEGFQKLVEQSNIQDKDLILSILKMYKDPEVRDREIRNLSSVFEVLADEILPQLRYSRITATIDVIGKTDSEIMEAFNSNPRELTVDELLYGATLVDDNNKKLAIYEAATSIYPNDFRTWNDLGLAQYVNKDYTNAANSFRKAASLNPDSKEAKMNLGLIEMLNGNYSKANQMFGSAAGVEGLNDALGTYYLKMGDNNSAVKAFANTVSNNAALAQLLTKDYSKARNTLATISKPDATTYYLLAVLNARTNNENGVISNLKQAIKLDNTIAARAAQDLEFANFNIGNL